MEEGGGEAGPLICGFSQPEDKRLSVAISLCCWPCERRGGLGRDGAPTRRKHRVGAGEWGPCLWGQRV